MTKVLPAPAALSVSAPGAVKEQEKGKLNGSEVVQMSQSDSKVTKMDEVPVQNFKMKKVFAVALIIVGIVAAIFALNILVGLTLLISGSTSAGILATSLATGVGKALTGIVALTGLVAGVWSIIKGYELWEESNIAEENLLLKNSEVISRDEEAKELTKETNAKVNKKTAEIETLKPAAGATANAKAGDDKKAAPVVIAAPVPAKDAKAASVTAAPSVVSAAPGTPKPIGIKRGTITTVTDAQFKEGQTELRLENNKVKEFPKGLTASKSVVEISFKNNIISSLPSDIGTMSQLRTLDMEGNDLTELPDSIGKLSNLERLSVRNNGITTLPKDLSGLVRLVELDLGDNKLDSIQPVFACKQLKILALRHTGLRQLSADIAKLTELTELDLRGNKLKTLPMEFARLIKLEKLNVCFNEFEVLPDVIKDLPALKELRITNKQIMSRALVDAIQRRKIKVFKDHQDLEPGIPGGTTVLSMK